MKNFDQILIPFFSNEFWGKCRISCIGNPHGNYCLVIEPLQEAPPAFDFMGPIIFSAIREWGANPNPEIIFFLQNPEVFSILEGPIWRAFYFEPEFHQSSIANSILEKIDELIGSNFCRDKGRLIGFKMIEEIVLAKDSKPWEIKEMIVKNLSENGGNC